MDGLEGTVNVLRDNLIHIGDGSMSDFLNAGVEALHPSLVRSLQEVHGEHRVAQLLQALQTLPGRYPITTDLSIILERWRSKSQPGMSMRTAKVDGKKRSGSEVTSEQARDHVRDLRERLTKAGHEDIVTGFLDLNPSAAPFRELLYDPSLAPMRLEYEAATPLAPPSPSPHAPLPFGALTNETYVGSGDAAPQVAAYIPKQWCLRIEPSQFAFGSDARTPSWIGAGKERTYAVVDVERSTKISAIIADLRVFLKCQLGSRAHTMPL